MTVTETWLEHLDRMFLGRDLYPHARIELVKKFSSMMPYQMEHYRRAAKEAKMRFSDYLIVVATQRIANTEIARKLHRDKIIKPYPKSAEYIRILIK